VESELLIEELRAAGVLADEGWDHAEASAHVAALREVGEDLTPELALPPRRVLHHSGGLVVLETPVEGEEESPDEGWVMRSLHFEASVGVVQTEVRYHPGRDSFDRSHLAFAVHGAMRELLVSLAGCTGRGLAAGAAVLGGGGGALPMALRAAGRLGGPLEGLGPVSVVERDASVAEAACAYFGFEERGAESGMGAELFVQDAVDFIERPPPSAPREFAAVLVDVAGAASHHSGEGVIAPPPALLTRSFVRRAAAAVRAAEGAVAWNVILGAGDDGAGLLECAEAVLAGASELSLWAVGPMPHDDGTTQWLLVAAAGMRPPEGARVFSEVGLSGGGARIVSASDAEAERGCTRTFGIE